MSVCQDLLSLQERDSLSGKCKDYKAQVDEAETALAQLKSDLAISERERRELEEVCLSACLSVYLYVCLSVCLFVRFSGCLFVCPIFCLLYLYYLLTTLLFL